MADNGNTDPGVSAVQIGEQRIEYHKPDLTLAYAALAPLVTEALAYYECDSREHGRDALRRAKAVIDRAATTVVSITPESSSS